MKRLIMALILGLVAVAGIGTASAQNSATSMDSIQAP
jgi:outer membrane lipoprotein-sorting protein